MDDTRLDRTPATVGGRRDAERFAAVLLPASTAVLFGCSAMLLTHLGWDYDSSGGTLIDKVHPGTFLAVLALCAGALTRGLISTLERFLRRCPEAVAAADEDAFAGKGAGWHGAGLQRFKVFIAGEEAGGAVVVYPAGRRRAAVEAGSRPGRGTAPPSWAAMR